MPTTASTTTAQVSTDTTAFDRGYRYALRSNLIFPQVADVMPVDQTHAGSAVTFNVGNDFAVATSPLAEGSDVSPVAGSDTPVTISPSSTQRHYHFGAKLRGTNYIL